MRNLVYPFYVIPGGGERVRLPEIQLDDRRFQDLVYEARLRISRAPARSGPSTTSPTPASR